MQDTEKLLEANLDSVSLRGEGSVVTSLWCFTPRRTGMDLSLTLEGVINNACEMTAVVY